MNRHALLIGINEYPFLRRLDTSGKVLESHDLQGCVQDAETMAQLLSQRFQFPAEQVQLLRNAEATRDEILLAMKKLLDRVQSSDVVVFYFAGHGSQMADREGTKFDPPLDDTIVPFDSGRNLHPSRDITDDEIRLWLLDLAEKTPYITLMFDCCHSATMHRMFGSVTAIERGLPTDTRSVRDLPPSPIPAEKRSLLQSKSWLPAEDRYVYIAACLAKEKAKEVTAVEGAELVHHGALTYALLQAIEQASSRATYRDVFEQAAFQVTQRISDQHPQAEGALHRSLFDTVDCPPLSYLLVKEVVGSRITLAAGRPMGAVVGSEWALFPPGSSDLTIPESRTIPRVRITVATATSAQGVLLDDATSMGVGPMWRAVMAVRPIETRWPVRVLGNGIPNTQGALAGRLNSRDSISALLSGISQSPWLRLADEMEDSLLTVHLVGARATVDDQSLFPQLGRIAGDSWLIVDASGQIRAPLAMKIQTELVRQNLEKIVRHRFMVELRNPNSRLRSKIEFSILPAGPVGNREPLHTKPTDVPIVMAKTKLLFQIRNLSPSPIYVTLLAIDALSGVRQIYPVSGTSAPLGANGMGLIGDGEGSPLSPEKPANLPVCSDGKQPQTAWLDVLLFASLQPLDLRPLLQESVRSQNRSAASPGSALSQLLSNAASSKLIYRSYVTPASQTDDWTIEHRALRIQ